MFTGGYASEHQRFSQVKAGFFLQIAQLDSNDVVAHGTTSYPSSWCKIGLKTPMILEGYSPHLGMETEPPYLLFCGVSCVGCPRLPSGNSGKLT